MNIKDISVAVIIVAILMIIILPIPAALLDVLLAINISVSLVILLNTIYSKDALQMSVFPSLLLIITIFRISLNVTTTKLILGESGGGDKAGAVVEAFGNFVTRGNMVVGFVIFIIIMIVQFLVITKGSERVSEVAARFTLDAMPGKQMAIDADLNSGLINEEQAKERRKKVQEESDFYGAMDGASKFVKGDAIASIIITVINLIGGLIIGILLNGEEPMQALNTYALLTVGDGLVSQISALLISTATGIIVTRAGSDSNLSQDLLKQIFQSPKVMIVAAVMSFILGLLGLPTVPFTIIAIILSTVGFRLLKEMKEQEQIEQVQVEETEVEEIRKPENVVTLLQVDPIELEFGYGIIPIADINQGGDLLDRVVMIRRQLALELGMLVPVIRLRDNIQLAPNQYIIKIKGVEVARGELMFDHLMAMNSGTAEGQIDGIETVEPAFGLPAIWISERQRDRAEMLGYTVVDPPSIIATHLTEIIRRYSHKLLGRQEVQTLIDNVKENYPVIIDELIPKLMTIGEIQKVLANLLKESICIRDMVTILETLADYATITHDTDILTEYVRQALSKSISQKYLNTDKASVITVDPEVEQAIIDSVQRTEFGSYITLQPEIIQRIMNSLVEQTRNLTALGQQPIVLTSPNVRPHFKKISEQMIPGLVVLSYNEIDSEAQIQSIGMVTA